MNASMPRDRLARSARGSSSLWRDALWRLAHDPLAIGGIVLIAIVLFAALIGPVVSPYDSISGSLANRLRAPDHAHWMGTDLQGRDELTRVLYGARVSLITAVASVAIGFFAGVLIGALAATSRAADAILMRVVDVLLAFPHILLAIAVVAALGRGLPQIMVAIGIGQVGTFARLLRGGLIGVREAEFVLAARSLGASEFRIFSRHMLPNALTPVLVYSTLALASAMASIAGLGFLGLGPPDPRTPEWGTMLTESVRFLRDSPHLLVFPGSGIVVTILGFNLLGDGLRAALDPKLRG